MGAHTECVAFHVQADVDAVPISSPLLSVIVPVYNEARTIDELLARVLRAPYGQQIIIVDDGSDDGTDRALRAWAAIPGVVVLTHSANLGKGHAIRTGLRYAAGTFTIIQDADLEYDPADYAKLLEPLQRGQADMALGSRYLHGTHAGVGVLFRSGVRALNCATRALYGIRLTDEATCYKVTRTAILRRMDLCCTRFDFCPEVVAKACRMGLRIVEVPVSYEPRTSIAGKKIRLRDGLAALRALWRWRKWDERTAPAEAAHGRALPAPLAAQAILAPRGAFSLVELLVVMGIITLLIGLILPAIVSSQREADRVRCLAVLRGIGAAAQFHEVDHEGYLPVGGWQFPSPTSDNAGGGSSTSSTNKGPPHIATPQGLGDPEERHFVYYLDSGTKRPAPVTAALGRYFAISMRFGSREELTDQLQAPAIRQLFRCPAQSWKKMRPGLTQRDGEDGWTSPPEFSGYIFNEAVMGMRDMAKGQGAADREPPVGNMAKVKHPASVMLACDGRPRDAEKDDWLMAFDKTAHDTLYDFQQNTLHGGWGKDSFDYDRHHGTLNVLFLDGHAESVRMSPGGLATVGLSKGVYD